MSTDTKIAEISIEPKTGNIKHIELFNSNLRFKCERCATFCCKLGGPVLSSKDVERLKKAGLSEPEFLETTSRCLRNTVSGSCKFLRFDPQKQLYECTIYPYRPTLCRLYPFDIRKTRSDRFALELLPCKGINRQLGAVIDEHFIIDEVLGSLLDVQSQLKKPSKRHTPNLIRKTPK